MPIVIIEKKILNIQNAIKENLNANISRMGK
jgi:hypothetical protein